MLGLKTRAKELFSRLRESADRYYSDRILFAVWSSHVLQARTRYQHAQELSEVGFRCFSQSNEDGIIDFIFQRLELSSESRFLEIGTQDYAESNTRFLYTLRHLEGEIVDCCRSYQQNVMKVLGPTFWQGFLKVHESFVTLNNIDKLCAGDYDLISLDIDGNDFWILSKLLDCLTPKIVVCEYNPVFGASKRVSIPYKADFSRYELHSSGLAFGMSLRLAVDLCCKHDLVFIGTNSFNNNAFFVHSSIIEKLPKTFIIPNTDGDLSAYTRQVVHDSRDENGELTQLKHEDALALLSRVEIEEFSRSLVHSKKRTISEIFEGV